MDIALVTCSGDERTIAVDAPLVRVLEDRDVVVHTPAWDDPSVAWDRFDLAVVRTTWDYTGRRDEFVAWAEHAGSRTELHNRPDVLRWNTHKGYLIELEERGAPTVPTAWLAQGDDIDLAALLASRRWPAAVVKPAVDAGSFRLARVDAADAGAVEAGQKHLDGLLAVGDAMIQPFLPAITTAGETSFVLLDGAVAYAVRKVPAGGDFRVQVGWGGVYTEVEPPRPWADLARWIVESTGQDLLYARVDLVPDETGSPLLAELEATEPDLYLGVVPGAADRVADAILARVG